MSVRQLSCTTMMTMMLMMMLLMMIMLKMMMMMMMMLMMMLMIMIMMIMMMMNGTASPPHKDPTAPRSSGTVAPVMNPLGGGKVSASQPTHQMWTVLKRNGLNHLGFGLN